MKRIIVLMMTVFALKAAIAQQRPQYTQYVLNNYILNPALTGIENYTDLKMSVRDQWVGLNGAPRTMYLSVHKPIGKKDFKTSATSFDMPGANPRGEAYWENYEASAPHHGVGFSMVNDITGLYSRFSANVSYAYHMGLSPKTNLAAGFAGGIQKVSRDGAKSTFANNDPFDPAQGSGADIYKIRPDLSMGLWLYSADYFLGLSAQQIIPQKVAFNNDTLGFKLVPHMFGTAGYRFLLNDDINAIPSVMFKYVPNTPTNPQFDVNVKVQYRDLLWVGASYRYKYGYAGMLGINLGNTVNFGYSYDYTTTTLNTASNGTHEFVLGFLIGNKYGDTCPRNVW